MTLVPEFLACVDTTLEQQNSRQKERDAISPPPSDAPRCSSTLPYALSRWPERAETTTATKRQLADDVARRGGRLKSDSDSTIASKSSPVEVRRKLSLLEEKRAIFQRRFFDSSSRSTRDTQSDDTVIIVGGLTSSVADEQREEEERRRRARQISVRTFDTFSTFKDTLDSEGELAYLESGFEEDYTDSCGRKDGDYASFHAAMASIVGAMDHPEKVEITYLPLLVCRCFCDSE